MNNLLGAIPAVVMAGAGFVDMAPIELIVVKGRETTVGSVLVIEVKGGDFPVLVFLHIV